MVRLITILGLIVAMTAGGCSDDSDTTDVDASVDGAPASDTSVDIILPDAEQVCGDCIYPCAPYGTNADDVAENMEFIGWSDPDEHTKAHADKVMDLSTKKKIAFKDYFGCPAKKRKLLWVMVSAGWCGPCQLEVKDTQTQINNGAMSEDVGVMNIIFETDNPGEPITESFAKLWAEEFKLTFPVVMDPSFKMGKYFSAKATPFNMFVFTDTMKICWGKAGADLNELGQKMMTCLSQVN